MVLQVIIIIMLYSAYKNPEDREGAFSHTMAAHCARYKDKEDK